MYLYSELPFQTWKSRRQWAYHLQNEKFVKKWGVEEDGKINQERIGFIHFSRTIQIPNENIEKETDLLTENRKLHRPTVSQCFRLIFAPTRIPNPSTPSRHRPRTLTSYAARRERSLRCCHSEDKVDFFLQSWHRVLFHPFSPVRRQPSVREHTKNPLCK